MMRVFPFGIAKEPSQESIQKINMPHEKLSQIVPEKQERYDCNQSADDR